MIAVFGWTVSAVTWQEYCTSFSPMVAPVLTVTSLVRCQCCAWSYETHTCMVEPFDSQSQADSELPSEDTQTKDCTVMGRLRFCQFSGLAGATVEVSSQPAANNTVSSAASEQTTHGQNERG